MVHLFAVHTGLSGFITEYYGEIAYAANPSALPANAYSLSLSASLLISIPYGLHLVSIALLFLTAPISFSMHALQVPSMRFVEKLGMLVSERRKNGKKNELLRSKESAMLDQVQEYDSRGSHRSSSRFFYWTISLVLLFSHFIEERKISGNKTFRHVCDTLVEIKSCSLQNIRAQSWYPEYQVLF